MKFTGQYEIAAPRAQVWAALNDPDILRKCIPGCERLEKKSDTDLEADVVVKIGPVKAKFKGAVQLEFIEEGASYRISGEGKGGVAGFAKGGAQVDLEEQDGQTVLRYAADARVGGKLAQIGSRLIDATARKLADQFFDTLRRALGGEAGAEEGAAQPLPAQSVPEQPGTGQPEAEKDKVAHGGISPALVWSMVCVAVLIVMIWLINWSG